MNTITINTALIIAMVCMIIGFATGGFIGLTNRKKKDKKQEEANQSPLPASSTPPPLADPEKFTELVRLWRSKETSKLFVETSGHLLATSSPLNPAQKKRFIDLIKELAGWLDISAHEIMPEDEKVTPATSEIEPAPVVRKASEPVQTNPIPAASATPAVPNEPVAPPPPGVAPVAEIQSVSPPPPPVAVPVAAMQSTPPPPPPVPVAVSTAAARTPSEPLKKKATSMVEQIDEVLQELIQQSDNPGRRIRLVEEQREGVIVWVGQEHFVGIDAVTDQAAKELIRAAVKEWDRRTEIH